MPTTLMSTKVQLRRMPEKMTGSAAGSRIFRNICDWVSLRLRPTLMSTCRTPIRPSVVLMMMGARPVIVDMTMIVMELRPNITRKSGKARTRGAAASAATQSSMARRRAL